VNVDTVVATSHGSTSPLQHDRRHLVDRGSVGTLASEARRGSLDMVAASPFGRRRIALEKLAAHVTGMTAVMSFVAFMAGPLPTPSASCRRSAVLAACVGFVLWVGLIGLVSGSVAWALAPFVSRQCRGSRVRAFWPVMSERLRQLRAVAGGSGPPELSTGPPANSACRSVRLVLACAGRHRHVVLYAVAWKHSRAATWMTVPSHCRPCRSHCSARVAPLAGIRRAAAMALPGHRLAVYAGYGGFQPVLRRRANRAPDLTRMLHTVFPGYDLAFRRVLAAHVHRDWILVAGLGAATLASGWLPMRPTAVWNCSWPLPWPGHAG